MRDEMMRMTLCYIYIFVLYRGENEWMVKLMKNDWVLCAINLFNQMAGTCTKSDTRAFIRFHFIDTRNGSNSTSFLGNDKSFNRFRKNVYGSLINKIIDVINSWCASFSFQWTLNIEHTHMIYLISICQLHF